MVSIKDRLTQLFSSALREAFSDLTDPPAALTPSTKENFGDYQCNSAMNIAQVKKNSWIFLKIDIFFLKIIGSRIVNPILMNSYNILKA